MSNNIFSVFNKLFQYDELKIEVDKEFPKVEHETSNIVKKEKIKIENCYVLFATDGDTFLGMHNKEKKTFRLAGVDTPEKGQKMHREASNFLNDKIKKKNVFIEILGKDVYDRLIVEVYLDKDKKIHINDIVIEEGFGKSKRYTNSDGSLTHNSEEYIQNEILEKNAQIKDVGIWGNNKVKPR